MIIFTTDLALIEDIIWYYFESKKNILFFIERYHPLKWSYCSILRVPNAAMFFKLFHRNERVAAFVAIKIDHITLSKMSIKEISMNILFAKCASYFFTLSRFYVLHELIIPLLTSRMVEDTYTRFIYAILSEHI